MLRAFFDAFGKRCHVHFCGFRQKMLPTDEGRISHPQSALEQLYQNCCTTTREAGGLPTYRGMTSCPKAGRCLMEKLPLFLEQVLLAPLSKGRDKAGLDVREVATTWCSRQRLDAGRGGSEMRPYVYARFSLAISQPNQVPPASIALFEMLYYSRRSFHPEEGV